MAGACRTVGALHIGVIHTSATAGAPAKDPLASPNRVLRDEAQILPVENANRYSGLASASSESQELFDCLTVVSVANRYRQVPNSP